MGTVPSQFTTPVTTPANLPPVWKVEHLVEGRRFIEWYAQDVTWRDYPSTARSLAQTNLDRPYPFATKRDAERAYLRKHGTPFQVPQAVWFYTHVTQHRQRIPMRRPALAVGFKPGDLVELALTNQRGTRFVPLARVQLQEVTA